MSCYTVLCVQSSFSVISLRKRELVALLNCLPADFWLLVFCVAVNWSALSDCDISWSYILVIPYLSENKSVLLCKLLNCLSNNELSHSYY